MFKIGDVVTRKKEYNNIPVISEECKQYVTHGVPHTITYISNKNTVDFGQGFSERNWLMDRYELFAPKVQRRYNLPDWF